MKNYSELVIELCNLEQVLQLELDKIRDVPIWRIVRRKYRGRYLSQRNISNPLNDNFSCFDFFQLLKVYFISLKQFLKLMFGSKKYENMILGFPRLEKIDGIYLDKFVDPLISGTRIKDSYVYFERGRSGKHFTPRLNNESVVYTEFLDFTSQILGVISIPIVFLCNSRKFMNVFRKASKSFTLTAKDYISIVYRCGVFIFFVFFLKIILRRLQIKRFFGVSAILFFKYTIACKELGITIYELQHGITTGPTTAYSGIYNEKLAPDYFLAFGKSSMKEVFSVPLSKMIDIGWAFKNFIKNHTFNILYPESTYLIVSDPEITHCIIDTSIQLSQMYPNCEFHIRLHPQERLTEDQQNILLLYKNILLQDNAINSNIALLSYRSVLGENSTVLYEALSMGRKVGRFCFNGFSPQIMPDFEQEYNFFYIKSINDFSKFCTINNDLSAPNSIYSDFNADIVNNLL